jgi:hypothetical protein
MAAQGVAMGEEEAANDNLERLFQGISPGLPWRQNTTLLQLVRLSFFVACNAGERFVGFGQGRGSTQKGKEVHYEAHL